LNSSRRHIAEPACGHEFGRDAKRDFLWRFSSDGQADGRVQEIEARGWNALSSQLKLHELDASPASDNPT